MRFALALAALGILVAAALVAGGAVGIGPLTPVFYQPISIAANGGIVGAETFPYPEGPPLKPAPLAAIKPYIPDPLPAPLFQWFCDGGADVRITLRSGRQVIYGPCYLPGPIERLRNKMIQLEGRGG